jgi:hypothetical protein
MAEGCRRESMLFYRPSRLAWTQGKSEGILLWELDLQAELRTVEGDVQLAEDMERSKNPNALLY